MHLSFCVSECSLCLCRACLPRTSSAEGFQQTTEKLFVKSAFVGSILQMLLCCVIGVPAVIILVM